MIKKLLIIFSLFILTSCTSMITFQASLPSTDIERIKDSSLAVVSTEYAGDVGIPIIIQNKKERMIEILWNRSKINGEKILLSSIPYEEKDKDLESEYLIPNFAYTRVIFPKSGVRGVSSFYPLKYPLKIEIVFRYKSIEDSAIIIVNKGEKRIKKKADLQGRLIDEEEER